MIAMSRAAVSRGWNRNTRIQLSLDSHTIRTRAARASRKMSRRQERIRGPSGASRPKTGLPSPADQAFATEHAPGVDVHRFARLFVESCRSHGYRYVNHSAAFRTWLLHCWEKPDAAHAACRTNHQHSQRNYPPARHQPGAVRSSANRDTTLAALDLLA